MRRRSETWIGSLWNRSSWPLRPTSRHGDFFYLRFHSGDVYRYFTVPSEQYQEFLDADSQGRYFRAHIRNQFP